MTIKVTITCLFCKKELGYAKDKLKIAELEEVTIKFNDGTTIWGYICSECKAKLIFNVNIEH